MQTALAVIAILVAAPAPKEVPKKEPASILGVWYGETAVIAGQADPPPPGMSMAFEKEGKAFMTEGAPNKPDEMSYTLDAAKGHIDLTEGKGPGQETMRGIYKIDGDTLTICLSIKGERPKEFASPVNSTNILLTLRRAKRD